MADSEKNHQGAIFSWNFIAQTFGRKNSSNTCAVALCPSLSGLTYHKFPKRKRTTIGKWIRACNRKDKFNTANAYVCEKHFLSTDYINYTAKRKVLKSTAVPSQYLGTDVIGSRPEYLQDHTYATTYFNSKSETAPTETEHPTLQKHAKVEPKSQMRKTFDQAVKDVKTIRKQQYELQSDGQKIRCQLPEKGPGPLNQLSAFEIGPQLSENTKENLSNGTKSNVKDCETCTRVGDENAMLKRQLYLQNQTLRRLRKRLTKVDRSDYKRKVVIQELSKIHSKATVNFIMGKTNRPGNWTEKEITQAFELYKISDQSYRFLREKNLQPLPSVSTLRSWKRSWSYKPEIKDIVLKAEKVKKGSVTSKKTKKLEDKGSRTSPSAPSFVADKAIENVVYGNCHEQVADCQMPTALLQESSSWEQPVWMNLDNSMNQATGESI